MTMRAKPPVLPGPEVKNILGIDVASLGWDEAAAFLRGLVSEKRHTKIGFLNAHSANIACADPEFAGTLAKYLVLPDGIGVDIAARILYGAPFPANLNGTDFIPAFLRSTPARLRVALLGTTRRNVEAAARALARQSPQHEYTVVHDGFFGDADEPVILASIAHWRPDVLLVAMGVPRQELWIARSITAQHGTVAIAVGALFDFLSGAVPRAPVWMRRTRLEWVYRLCLEPARLWRRYIVGNPLFLFRVLRQRLAARRAGP